MSNTSKFRLSTVAAIAGIGMIAAIGAVADPNPDSAAGICGGGGSNKGIGDAIGGDFVPNLKAGADAAGMSLGQFKKYILLPRGFGIPDGCAPGKQPS